MNRRVLLWLIAIALLATVGCRPRHPPHTPQPLNMMGATSGPPQSVRVEDLRHSAVPSIQQKSLLTDNHATHYYCRP
jgi:hypothetical protein